VLTNLIFNAVDAHAQGRRLCFAEGKARPRSLEVSDTGMGMTEETARNVRAILHMKAPVDGLGLAMSYGIIRRHGAAFHQEPLEPRHHFYDLLPVPKEAPAPVVSGRKQASVRCAFYLVDDHPAIREIVSAYLAEDRHVVAPLVTPRKRWRDFARNAFDLVIRSGDAGGERR